MILYSRPVYFCLSSSILLLSIWYLENQYRLPPSQIYGFDIFNNRIIEIIRDGNMVFLLSFPILFSLGLLPQINTFLMYVFEQIDIHAFGGTAATMGLASAVYALSRSLIAVSLLCCFALISMADPSPTQSVMFSIFCGFLVSTSYHLSRSSSDPSIYWNLIKKCFTCQKMKERKSKSTEQHAATDDKEDIRDSQEINDPLPKKLEKTVVSFELEAINLFATKIRFLLLQLMRLQSDIIICIFIAIVVFATHVSTIFTLQV